MPTAKALVLSYSGCSTCRKAIRWLDEHDVEHTLRAIVDQPPTARELARWIPQSGLPTRKWLNTSGQSYRALGKPTIDAASDEQLRRWLSADGKLVKRPLIVAGDRVLVGFTEEAYEGAFARRRRGIRDAGGGRSEGRGLP